MASRDLRTILAGLLLALAAAAPLPRVLAVAPSGATVPERLLRLSLTFEEPPEGAVFPLVSLRGQDGQAIEGALLDQELWSPDRRTLTLLLDPGRVKTGLLAHEQHGWALPAGQRVALWLGDMPVHRWRVRAGGCTVPDISAWRIEAPAAGGRAPLTLRFPGPIDARGANLIALADASGLRIDGEARLLDGEQAWRFVPAAPWRAGRLRLRVHPSLESPCGDAIGEAFEHPAGTQAPVAASRWIAID